MTNFRIPAFVSAIWRGSARDKSCTLRLDCCNHDPATTVLCHIRRFGWGGTACKPHDFLAVYACSACHDVLDSRDAAASIGDDWHGPRVEHWTIPEDNFCGFMTEVLASLTTRPAPAPDSVAEAATLQVPRALIEQAHAAMVATGWDSAQEYQTSDDGLIEAAVSEIEVAFRALAKGAGR